MHTEKQMEDTFGTFHHNFRISMRLYNGNTPVAQLYGCYGLDTTDEELVLNRAVEIFLVYSIQI